jgi:hypothetical protein
MRRYIRNLVIWVVCWGVAYNVGATASKGLCAGGEAADGVQHCTRLTMGPSWLVSLALVVIVVVALTRAGRHARTPAVAVRMLQRTALVIALVAAGSIALSLLSFFALPLDGASGMVSGWLPFPFATVTVGQVPLAP